MSRIIAVANQKGGVGKTTTAVNLAASLAAVSKRVLLVDCDPQGNASSAYGITEKDSGITVYNMFHKSENVRSIVHNTFIKNLDVIPSHRDLYGIEVEMVDVQDRHLKIKAALEQLTEYSEIILDCPPGLGILCLNSLVAAHEVIVPVQCEYYSLEGLSEIMSTVKLVKKNFNPRLVIGGLLLTMHDRRSLHAVMIEDDVRRNLGKLVYETVIPRNIRIAEAPSYGKPVLFYDIKSKGAQAYISFAREFLRRDIHDAAA